MAIYQFECLSCGAKKKTKSKQEPECSECHEGMSRVYSFTVGDEEREKLERRMIDHFKRVREGGE